MIGLDDQEDAEVRANAGGEQGVPGDFSVSTPIERGNRYLVPSVPPSEVARG